MASCSNSQLDPLRLLDDEALMSRVVSGDKQAFEVLYDRFSPELYPLGLRILRKPCDAQIVLLDVFEEVWRRRERFNPDRGSVRTYLMTLLRSRAIDAYRRDQRRHEVQQEAYEQQQAELQERQRSDDPQQLAIHSENGQLVREALDTLTHQQRQTLQLAYFDGLSHQQIADQTKTPLGTVKTHIRQGMIKLRSILHHVETGRVKP